MEQSKPLVSAVIPVYNVEKYLRECLESISGQTYDNWEAILVDDGSKDGSGRICDEAAAKDARFRVIHKENGGVSIARNTGIEAAQGKYVLFIDSDDVVCPNYFEEMVRTAETYGSDLVLCGFDRFNDEWETTNRLMPLYVGFFRDIEQYLMLYTVSKTNMFGVSIWAKLFRRDLLMAHNLRFDPAISYEEDCNFMADVIPHLRTVTALGESMYRYRQMEESLSKGYRKDTFRFLVHGYQRRCALLKEHGLDEFLPKLKEIFFTVVKTACQKIALSGLPRKERIEEYAKLMEFPEVIKAVTFERKSRSGLTNRISAAIRKKNAKKLDRTMRVWVVKDKAVDCVKDLKDRLRNRGQKEEKK
ncbi:MAG: glycosyltransferase [Clostridia bacterium]|nr:glycosyltransferase [Clostridia bacterium]